MPTRFELHRDTDISGVSGTGLVAEGFVFSDGIAVLHWLGELSSTVVHESVENVVRIHGHGGATRLVFANPCAAFGKCPGIPEWVNDSSAARL